MKALLCGICVDIQALQEDWRRCKCGNVEAHWVDPRKGTAEFRAKDKSFAFLLGLNNQMLGPAVTGDLRMWEDWREQHEKATKAPGYVFDKSKAGCWAVVVQAGTTNDVKWASLKDEDDSTPR